MNRLGILSSLFLLCSGSFFITAANLDFTSLQISDDSYDATHPSVGVSADGHIMAVWWNANTERIMARIYTPGVGIGEITEIPGQTMPSTWPRVRGGAGGEFHVVWSAGYAEHNHSIQYSHYNGSGFSSAITIQSGASMWPDLCFNASTNTVSVCWEEFFGGVQGEIMVRQRINGNWSNEVNGSKTPYYSGRAHIATDGSGNLYLAWMEKTGGTSDRYEAYYNRTVNGSWQNPVNISNDGSMRVLPNLAVKPNGSEVVVQWFKMTDHYHWGRVITYNNNTPSYGTSHRIAQGSYDHLHYYTGMVYHQNILYMTYINASNQVCIKNYEGNNSWGEGGTLTGANCPRTPDIGQSSGQGLGVVWYNRCDSPNKIYFAYGSGFGGPDPDDTDPDFNGDGQTDLLWRNMTNGKNVVWYMDTVNKINAVSLTNLSDVNWDIVALADFNSDDKTDLLWRNMTSGKNVIWLMNGTNRSSTHSLPPVSDTSWIVAGCADFNSDRKPDILWHNTSTGNIKIWTMNGITRTSSVSIASATDPHWMIVGCADFNSDSKPDILWRNPSTGKNAVWSMNGYKKTGTIYLNPVTNIDWVCIACSDFNNDSKPDILWRYMPTGKNAVWIMNGFTKTNTLYMPAQRNMEWELKN